MKQKRIFIVEDYAPMREELKRLLESAGYEVVAASKFERIADAALSNACDLVLLDINLPGMSGFQVLRQIRAQSELPVLMLTARDTQMDELMSLELGADDFVTKPFNREILLARIRTRLRSPLERERELDLGYLRIQTGELIAANPQGDEVLLTGNEFKLLYALAKAKGNVLTREELMIELWRSDEFIDENTLNVNMSRLRQSLAKILPEDCIRTVRGVGY
ncbi:MAG: response regulator transcription factor, partial [Tissierellia bacterium]|nr:response regulator transcription factor [Tissierellia bacterium]